jgi:SAM-dependent methyltransferase
MPHSPEDWARLLRSEWESRARSSSRDFFIASHPGWDQPARWEAQARQDASVMLHGLGEQLAAAHVLELGCGVGRLAPHVAPHALSYTGVDIAAPMVAEARRRHAALPRTRFLEGDGLTLPAVARDRGYGLAFAHAVFIHCPKELIAVLVTSAFEALVPGGELRFQLRADPSDPAGLAAPPQSYATSRASAEDVAGVLEGLDPSHTSPHYMGHAFRFDEARAFLAALVPGRSEVLRFDPPLLYGRITRPA